MLAKAPFAAAPAELFRTEQRFDGFWWGEQPGLAFMREYDENRHWVRTFQVNVDEPACALLHGPPAYHEGDGLARPGGRANQQGVQHRALPRVVRPHEHRERAEPLDGARTDAPQGLDADRRDHRGHLAPSRRARQADVVRPGYSRQSSKTAYPWLIGQVTMPDVSAGHWNATQIRPGATVGPVPIVGSK
jgi:hypothetical protein